MLKAATDLRTYLVENALAGQVATTVGNTLRKCLEIWLGSTYSSFGLLDYERASGQLPTMVQVAQAVADLAGDPQNLLVETAAGWQAELDDPQVRQLYRGTHKQNWPKLPKNAQLAQNCAQLGWIDPDRTLESIELHRHALANAAGTKARVLCATGHPTCLQVHYAPLVAALENHGATILTPAAEQLLPAGYEPKVRDNHQPRVRYYAGVAMLSTAANLYHTHRPDLMVKLLADLAAVPAPERASQADQLPDLREHVDLVIADHGLAGAAIARGIPTISIADVNDSALPLARMQGRTEAVLCIDDNLAPSLYGPITAAMLAGWA